MEHLEGRQSVLAALRACQRRFQVILIRHDAHREKVGDGIEVAGRREAAGCQISNLKSQISDLRLQISDLRSQISDVRFQRACGGGGQDFESRISGSKTSREVSDEIRTV